MLFLWRLQTPENSEKIYEVEDLLEVFDGLQKTTRSFLQSIHSMQMFWSHDQPVILSIFAGRILENHQREQRERYESQAEGLKLKVDHLQNENSKLQNLFQEKSNINEMIHQEVSRLSSENSVCHGFLRSTSHFSSRMSRVQDVLWFVLSFFCLFECHSQVIPELKVQVSELQKQKQELKALVEEKNKELAGKHDF